jgi:hypothetical protein
MSVTVGSAAEGVAIGVIAGSLVYAEVGDVYGSMGESVGTGVAMGAGEAALHPASSIARSVETIAIVMKTFFILFTFPFGFLHYLARNEGENAGRG